MIKDYNYFDLSQFYEDITDYLVLIDGVLEVMPNSDPDYKNTQILEGHINGILETIDELCEAQGGFSLGN